MAILDVTTTRCVRCGETYVAYLGLDGQERSFHPTSVTVRSPTRRSAPVLHRVVQVREFMNFEYDASDDGIGPGCFPGEHRCPHLAQLVFPNTPLERWESTGQAGCLRLRQRRKSDKPRGRDPNESITVDETLHILDQVYGSGNGNRHPVTFTWAPEQQVSSPPQSPAVPDGRFSPTTQSSFSSTTHSGSNPVSDTPSNMSSANRRATQFPPSWTVIQKLAHYGPTPSFREDWQSHTRADLIFEKRAPLQEGSAVPTDGYIVLGVVKFKAGFHTGPRRALGQLGQAVYLRLYDAGQLNTLVPTLNVSAEQLDEYYFHRYKHRPLFGVSVIAGCIRRMVVVSPEHVYVDVDMADASSAINLADTVKQSDWEPLTTEKGKLRLDRLMWLIDHHAVQIPDIAGTADATRLARLKSDTTVPTQLRHAEFHEKEPMAKLIVPCLARFDEPTHDVGQGPSGPHGDGDGGYGQEDGRRAGLGAGEGTAGNAGHGHISQGFAVHPDTAPADHVVYPRSTHLSAKSPEQADKWRSRSPNVHLFDGEKDLDAKWHRVASCAQSVTLVAAEDASSTSRSEKRDVERDVAKRRRIAGQEFRQEEHVSGVVESSQLITPPKAMSQPRIGIISTSSAQSHVLHGTTPVDRHTDPNLRLSRQMHGGGIAGDVDNVRSSSVDIGKEADQHNITAMFGPEIGRDSASCEGHCGGCYVRWKMNEEAVDRRNMQSVQEAVACRKTEEFLSRHGEHLRPMQQMPMEVRKAVFGALNNWQAVAAAFCEDPVQTSQVGQIPKANPDLVF